MDQSSDTPAEKLNPVTSWEELLAEGKRCLAAGDVASGVESFQNACTLMAEQYGQLARELAEPYYLYGKALLECARLDNTVLGSGIPVPDDAVSSDDEEVEEEEEAEEDGDGEVEKEEEGKSEKTGDEGDRDTNTTESTAPTDASESDKEPQPSHDNGADGEREGEREVVSSTDPETDVAGGSQGTGGSEGAAGPSIEEGKPVGEEEEEETDLKLAWEVLELARVICQKEESEEYKLKLSDVYFTLGEVALESDQMDQAVGDMNSGLQLRELLLEPHDRRLAEAHFNLGLAYALQKDTKRSIQEYKCARNSLSLRREKLVSEMEGKEESEKKGAEEELADLDSLLPDLDAKIKDACEEEKQQEEGEEMTTTGFPGSATDDKPTGGSKAPINDITHLVRKRPAVQDDDSVEGKSQKRIRIERDSSETDPVPPTNGTSSSPHSSEQ